MDTIKTYLETMFSTLPQTEESKRLKNEILISMEEKYNELKAEGKSENEAVGTVISEFGNIDELAEEMGLKTPQAEGETPVVELATVQEFLQEAKNTAKMTGLGVFFILFGVGALVFSILQGFADYGWSDFTVNYLFFGIPVFVIFLAVAVGMLVMTWLKFMKYEVFKHGFILPEHVRQYVSTCKNNFISTFVKCVVIGVVLILLSAPLVVIPAIWEIHVLGFGIGLCLAVVGLGCIPLVFGGIVFMGYQILLVPGYFQREFGGEWGAGIHSGGDINYNLDIHKIRVIGVISAVFWPLVTAGYLGWSFATGDWHITWILWVISGLVFAAVSGGIGAYFSIGGNKKD